MNNYHIESLPSWNWRAVQCASSLGLPYTKSEYSDTLGADDVAMLFAYDPDYRVDIGSQFNRYLLAEDSDGVKPLHDFLRDDFEFVFDYSGTYTRVQIGDIDGLKGLLSTSDVFVARTLPIISPRKIHNAPFFSQIVEKVLRQTVSGRLYDITTIPGAVTRRQNSELVTGLHVDWRHLATLGKVATLITDQFPVEKN